MIDLENITNIRKRIGRKFGLSEKVIDFIICQFYNKPPILAVLGGSAYYSPKHVDAAVMAFFKEMYPLGNGMMRNNRYYEAHNSDFKILSHTRFGRKRKMRKFNK